MDLIPWRSRGNDPMASLHAAMNRLFEDFERGLPMMPTSRLAPIAWPVSLDLGEDDKEIVVKADIPGLEEKDVDVQLVGRTLTVKGEKKQEREEKGKDWHVMERGWGSFMRQVEMPCDVDPEKVQATFAKGVLTVTLPKAASARERTRRIAVKAT